MRDSYLHTSFAPSDFLAFQFPQFCSLLFLQRLPLALLRGLGRTIRSDVTSDETTETKTTQARDTPMSKRGGLI